MKASARRPLVVSAELALAVVTLAAVLGMHRLFDGMGWFVPLTVNAVAAHITVTLCRRRGLSLPTTAVAMALGAALVATWTSYWSTTAVGVPTADTWSVMQEDLSQAWRLYQDVVAPAPVETGFVLASAVALWCVAYVADWAAFRLWVPFEATLPAGTLFLFTALLGTPRGRGWAVGLYAAALLGFLLLHRMARQDGISHWVAERSGQGHRSLLTAGAALGAMAVVTGVVFGPALPGAGDPGVLDPRSLRSRDDSRVTISPLVDIKSRLVNQADVEVFQVRSPVPSYWRLTSLERFDGRIWSSSGSFSEADGALPEAVPTELATQTFEQRYSISTLAAIWLPSAYEPRALAVDDVSVLYDEESATLIVDKGIESSDGLEYQVTSSSPRITAADLAGSSGAVPDDIQEQYLELPDDFSPRVRGRAEELTAGAATPYDAARALQDHLRTFTYDLTVTSGHSGDVLEQFLFDTQRGYCEQFAGAFAAMARSIGLPARVAVGFTTGVSDPTDPELYRVRGEHAHAWPEVFLAGAGWVSFEPTPGRGMPFAEDYTGAPVAQAAPGAPGASDVAPTTTLDASLPTPPTTPSRFPLDSGGVETNAGPNDGAGDDRSVPVRYLVRPVAKAAPIVALGALAYVLLFPMALVLRRWLRRRRATSAEARISLAWAEAVEEAALVGFQEVRSDTFDERAGRLAATLPEGDVTDDALRLARQLEAATYAPDGADDLAAELAEEAAAAVGAAARAASTRRRRVLRWLDPRPYSRRWRQGRALRQRRITTTVRADLEAEHQLVGTGDRV
jgi:transglutaminase-like putative cysteine protease